MRFRPQQVSVEVEARFVEGGNSESQMTRKPDPQGLLTFIHALGFDSDWKNLGLQDEDLWAAQLLIQSDPEGPPIVKATGGLRKMRFAPPGKSGRRKWFRICYVYFPDAAIVLLVIAYAKNESHDLSPEDKKYIRQMIARENKILSNRPIK